MLSSSARFIHQVPFCCPTNSIKACNETTEQHQNTHCSKNTQQLHGDRSFAATGPHLWNSLPSHLRHYDIAYNDFKRQLKTFLFEQTAAQHIVTLVSCALYKYFYLLTYLLVKMIYQFSATTSTSLTHQKTTTVTLEMNIPGSLTPKG